MSGYQLPSYPFRIPPEITDGSTRHYPVVIVGAGLAGLALAVDLGQRGIPTIVLDDDNTVGAAGISSRGICYAKRTLEIFERLGIAERVVAKGVLWNIGKIFKGSTELYRFDLNTKVAGKYPPFVNLQQFYVEEYLVDRLAQLPSVDLRWLNKVIGMNVTSDAATLDVETPAGRYQLRAAWVVAADGSQSQVRQSLELPSAATYFEDQWCIADLRPPLHMEAERRVWISADFNDGGAVFWHRMADGICRFDFQIGHYPDPKAKATREEIEQRLRKALGEDAQFELIWAGIWRFKHRTLARFRHDRVLFIGDAAHELPPFGARGGNGGIQDADNLGWKLALVVRGEASPDLLDTYNDERHAAALENIAISNSSALFLSPQTSGHKIFRDAACQLASVAPWMRQMVNAGRMSVANRYAPGGLVHSDQGHFESGIPAGAAAVDGRVKIFPNQLSHLLSALSGDFIALHFVPGPTSEPWDAPDVVLGGTSISSIRILKSDRGARSGDLIDPDGTLFTAYDAHQGATYVLRPDRHILLRSRLPSIRIDWSYAQASNIASRAC